MIDKKATLDQWNKKMTEGLNKKLHADRSDMAKSIVMRQNNTPEHTISHLLKMRNGVLTQTDLTPDLETNNKVIAPSDCKITVRLLSTHEKLEIDKAMLSSEFDVGSEPYYLQYVAKIISKATEIEGKPNDAIDENSILHNLTPSVLTALGRKYEQFLFEFSPRLETFTTEQLNDVVDYLLKETDQIKKYEFITTCNSMQMREIILALTNASNEDNSVELQTDN